MKFYMAKAAAKVKAAKVKAGQGTDDEFRDTTKFGYAFAPELSEVKPEGFFLRVARLLGLPEVQSSEQEIDDADRTWDWSRLLDLADGKAIKLEPKSSTTCCSSDAGCLKPKEPKAERPAKPAAVSFDM